MSLMVKEKSSQSEINQVCDFMINNIAETFMRSLNYSSQTAKSKASSIKFTNTKELLSIIEKNNVICYGLFFDKELLGVSVFNQKDLKFLFLGSHHQKSTIEILKILLKKNLILPVIEKK